MTKLKDLKKRFMEEPAFREEYARVDEEDALVEALCHTAPLRRSDRHAADGGLGAGRRIIRAGRNTPQLPRVHAAVRRLLTHTLIRSRLPAQKYPQHRQHHPLVTTPLPPIENHPHWHSKLPTLSLSATRVEAAQDQ